MSAAQEQWRKLPKDFRGELRWKNGWVWNDIYAEVSANKIVLSPKFNKDQKLKTISFTQIAEIAQVNKTLKNCFKISLKNGEAEQFQCARQGAQGVQMWVNNLRHAKKFWEDKERVGQRSGNIRKITLEKEDEASESLDLSRPRVFFTLWNGEMVGLLVENTSTFTDVYPRLFSSAKRQGTCCMCKLRHMISGLWAVDTSGRKRLAGKDEILMDLSRRGDLLFVLEHHQKLLIVHFSDSSYEILPAPSAITAGEVLKLDPISTKLDHLRCFNPGLFLRVESGEELLFQSNERPFKYPHGKLIARSKSVRVNSKKKTKEEIIAALRSDALIDFYRRQKANDVLKRTLADQIQKSSNMSDGLFFKEDHFALDNDVTRRKSAEPKEISPHSQGDSKNYWGAGKMTGITFAPYVTTDSKHDLECSSRNRSEKPCRTVSELQRPLTRELNESDDVNALCQTWDGTNIRPSVHQSSESQLTGCEVQSFEVGDPSRVDSSRAISRPLDQRVDVTQYGNDAETSKSSSHSGSSSQAQLNVLDSGNKEECDETSEEWANSSGTKNKANKVETAASFSKTPDHALKEPDRLSEMPECMSTRVVNAEDGSGLSERNERLNEKKKSEVTANKEENGVKHACYPGNGRPTTAIGSTVLTNTDSEKFDIRGTRNNGVGKHGVNIGRLLQNETDARDYNPDCNENFDPGSFKTVSAGCGNTPERSLSEPCRFVKHRVKKKLCEMFRSVSEPNLHHAFLSDKLEKSVATSEPDLNDENQCIDVHDVYDPKESSDDFEEEVFSTADHSPTCVQNHRTSLDPAWKVAKNVENAVKRVLAAQNNSRKTDELIANELCPSLMVIIENGLKKNPSFWSLIGKGINPWEICKIVSAATNVGHSVTPLIERACRGNDVNIKFRYFVRACIRENCLSKWFELLHEKEVMGKISENYEKRALLLEMANSAAMEHLKLYLDKLNGLKLQNETLAKVKSLDEDFLISFE